jgi:hypothetical protein
MHQDHSAITSDGLALVSVDGRGGPQLVRGSQPGDVPLRWAKEGNALFLGNRGETARQVSRLNIETGSRTGWKTFSPPDVAGIVGVACPRLAADEEHYVFGYIGNLSDLFLVEHLR